MIKQCSTQSAWLVESTMWIVSTTHAACLAAKHRVQLFLSSISEAWLNPFSESHFLCSLYVTHKALLGNNTATTAHQEFRGCISFHTASAKQNTQEKRFLPLASILIIMQIANGLGSSGQSNGHAALTVRKPLCKWNITRASKT